MTLELRNDPERADTMATLAKHRFFLRFTLRDLSEEQAASTPTVSELSLGGLVKHVTEVENVWVRFIEEGPTAFRSMSSEWDEVAILARQDEFRMLPGETLAGLLEAYEEAALRTAAVVEGLESLDLSHPLPEAPWFEAGASWSARRVLLHLIGETAQHAGHADILREAIDGSKTMG